MTTPSPAPAPTTATTGRFLYAASESHADLWYATGFLVGDPILWFEVPGLSAIHVSALELSRARKDVRPGVTVFSTTELRARFQIPEETRLTTEAILQAVGTAAGIIRWQTAENCPFGLATRMQTAGLVLEAVTPMFPERARKTPAEVELVREGVRLAEAGLTRALEILRAAAVGADNILQWNGTPLMAEQLRGEITATIARLGGTAAHTIAAPGVQGADPHQRGTGPVRANEPIVLDIFPRVDRTGYFGDLTRTVVKGRASDTVRRAFAAVQRAQQAGIAAVRAGIAAKEAHLAAERELEAAGFVTDAKADPPCGFFHGLGHGLGLEIHEQPRLSGKVDTLLEPGHVVTVEPGLYYPEWGGIRLEDVVVVTATGCENLTTAPVFLELPD
jgi:Xaa-Pro aminopeptidase